MVTACHYCNTPFKIKPANFKLRKHVFCCTDHLGKWKTEWYIQHPEEREKVRQWATGRIQSPETVAKRVAKTRGAIRTPDQRARIAAAIPRGERNHSWRGGISPIAYRLRRSTRFKEWRTAIFVRDDFTCRLCGARGGEIHPHHQVAFSFLLRTLIALYQGYDNQYQRLLDSHLLWSITNGQTLCKPCHLNTDNYGVNP